MPPAQAASPFAFAQWLESSPQQPTPVEIPTSNPSPHQRIPVNDRTTSSISEPHPQRDPSGPRAHHRHHCHTLLAMANQVHDEEGHPSRQRHASPYR